MEANFKRREFINLLSAGIAVLSATGLGACAPDASEEPARADADEPLGLQQPAGQHIAMLLYPNLTLLDLVGPQACFSALGMSIHLVWKDRGPITSDTGIIVTPTMTFAECPEDLEILFVPGSSTGTAPAARDPEVIAFLRSRGERAKFVTSVCTGSLLLGAAGLLRGYKATSHWATRDLLPLAGAERVDARYVEDRNRITGGGVTSGIDFGLHVVERLRGRPLAEVTQLILEYAPAPPFSAGSPETAPASAVSTVLAIFSQPIAEGRALLEDIRKRG